MTGHRLRTLGLSAAVTALAAWVSAQPAIGRPPPTLTDDDQIARLLGRLEEVLLAGDTSAFQALLTPGASSERVDAFTGELRPDVTRVVVKERDRQAVPDTTEGTGYRIVFDAFVQFGDRARVATWQFDLVKADGVTLGISRTEPLSSVDPLYRLSVTSTRQYEARGFAIRAEDLLLTLAEGAVFTIETDQGVTGLVVFGRGDMHFEPTPDSEKGQVRIFAGRDALDSRFDAAYIRFSHPRDHVDLSTLNERAVDARDLKRAQEVFEEESIKTYVLELGDLSSDNWSLLPADGDFLAEIRTRRFNTLTYVRSAKEPEDISVFDREAQRNISAYASATTLAERGRFYDEDDYRSYDVLNYDIDLAVDPRSLSMTGRARMRVRVEAVQINQLALRLADSLTVHSIVSDQFGRLFHVRVKGQDTLYVNLPATVLEGTDITLTIGYAGQLPPQTPDQETLQGGAGPFGFQQLMEEYITGEPKYLYSTRSYWYPQSAVSDYVSATMRISVPEALACVGSGELSSDSPQIVDTPDGRTRNVYVFTATRPVRYLAFLVTKLQRADFVTLAFDAPSAGESDGDTSNSGLHLPPAPLFGGAGNEVLDLSIEANPLQVSAGRGMMDALIRAASFYHSIIGDSPYEGFTLALVEHPLPGGHSPAYFATLNQPLPSTPFVWRTDPANFRGFPEFFLAHELAHQWWGQAVGWQNYHEQWLSEGFAQYFAALFAQEYDGDESFKDVLRQMRKWALDRSDQGPVYLGYRLGHIKHDSRTFRALVYNKGAIVLHMLRRLLGDDTFFRGLRRFYMGGRYSKVGTNDLRLAMEAESGQSLGRFFDRWIYGSSLPRISFSHEVVSTGPGQGREAVLRFRQVGEIFDLPVTVRLEYSDRRRVDIIVPVTDRVVEFRTPLDGTLRNVSIADDDGTLAEIR